MRYHTPDRRGDPLYQCVTCGRRSRTDECPVGWADLEKTDPDKGVRLAHCSAACAAAKDGAAPNIRLVDGQLRILGSRG